jgi:2'-hydroxyisoflavone reductase
MNTNRRQFIRTAAAAGGAVGLGLTPQLAAGVAVPGSAAPAPAVAGGATTSAPRRIRLLILGGTGFIGPHQVRYAMERGHEVTIFNRGRSAPGMFPGVEELTGDRAANDYGSLRGRTWDAVIDNSAARPPRRSGSAKPATYSGTASVSTSSSRRAPCSAT